MKRVDKTQIRFNCLIQAIGLKQNGITTDTYKDKNVVEIANELETYVFNGLKTKKD